MKILVLFFENGKLVDAGFFHNMETANQGIKEFGKEVSTKIIELADETAKAVEVFWDFGLATGSDFATNLLVGLTMDIVSGVLD